jgi:hypothetical protein
MIFKKVWGKLARRGGSAGLGLNIKDKKNHG